MPLQKLSLKKAFSQESYVHKAQALGDSLARTLFGATVSLKKVRDIVQNNYNLGLAHLVRGNISDAIMRFKLVVWLDPAYASAWYELGRACLADGRRSQAISALKRALKLKPQYEEALYMLAVAIGDTASAAELPKHIPLSIAQPFFEVQAENYNNEQLETLRYQGHLLLAAAVRKYLAHGRIDHVILDLGCGTGLVGPELRGIAVSITGVDFSAKMLEQAMRVNDAQGKKIYDALMKRDIQHFLIEGVADSYDIVLAARTFGYLGDLKEIFRQVVRILKPSGIFAFTTDIVNGTDFRFDTREGRFRYAKSYLQSLASMVGLSEIEIGEAPVYPESKMWLCVFRK